MKLLDALFNWLQIKVVSDAPASRPSSEGHRCIFRGSAAPRLLVKDITVEKDDTMYRVRFEVEGKRKVRCTT